MNSATTLTIAQALQQAHANLPQTQDPKREAEYLLCAALNCDRAYLYTWPEKPLSIHAADTYQRYVDQRQRGKPLAYITERQAFWTLDLYVNEHVLIPRPETELLVENTLKLLMSQPNSQVADLGTGSGAIACALAIERPDWEITATDQSPAALEIAQQNAQRHNLTQINFVSGNWFAPLHGQRFDAIISNPPYIYAQDPHLQREGLPYEPDSALVSAESGLQDLRVLIENAPKHLKPGGYLLLEHGYNQAPAVQALFAQENYDHIETLYDLNHTPRVTWAQY